MGNKFDMISANPSGSINNLNLLNETFHVFSKSPASDVTTLGGARLKSGHTTTTTDVWADEIPAFFNAANQAKFDLFSTLATKDDLCIFGGKVYQHNGEQFVSLGTEAEILVDGATFQKNNKDVIKYHKNRTAINLTADNNNGDGSNNLTAKIYDAAIGSTNFVSQFISSTDKMVAGVPSLAYDATVIAGGVKLAEGLTNDNDYICNSYAGVIQFNKARSQGSVTVSAWEYIGGILSDSIKFNEDELKKHKEELTAKNKSIHVNDTDRDKWDAAAAKADTAVQNVTSGNAYLERGTDDDNITLTLKVDTNLTDGATTNSVPSSAAVTNYGSSIISAHEAKKDGNKNIHVTASERSSWDTAATKAGTAVQTVKRANDSSTLINVNQSGTSVTIGLSNTVATKTDISSLEDKITDKTVRINAGTNNITAKLTENENAADSYTISVDGYTTEEVDSLLKNKADEKLLENTIGKVSEITKNLQDVESNLLKHTSNADEGVLHVTQAEKDIWNAGGTALQEIKEGDHIEVSGNTVGVNTSSLVTDTTFTNKVNELIGEELSTVEESINDINNELETYNYSIAQSIETGTTDGSPDNTRGFGTLITDNITLGKVITYCHSTGGAENSNIWLKVFEKSSPHIFKGISDTSLNHKHGATLEYTFKNSDIKLEANKEYFFVFCPESQKNSTTFQNSSDSIDCCIQTVSNTTGYGGVCGPTGISNINYIALHKIYKKPGKFAFAAGLEEETTRATQREEELENLIKNKVEALPSVYTGDNMFYTNCYGFEYTNPSENIIFDKIELKFAKNLDTLNAFRPEDAPEIDSSEISDNVCKIKVIKNYTEEIATSEYNSNKSGDINLLQFKFNKGISLESDCNYRFYFYDKNDALFAVPVIINTVNSGETLLNRNSVANRYLSGLGENDYWGTYWVIKDNYVFNGLGVKLINSVQEHINDESIHFSQKEYIIVDENGNPVEITFSDRITNGTQMFSSWAMDTFIHSLPQLKNGYQMFRNCKNLTTFLGELPLLEDGTQMFFSCKLNALSAITIIDSLKNNLAPAEKSYSIHLGISEETKTDENLLLALEESGNEVNSSYNITNKNGATWTINFIINA